MISVGVFFTLMVVGLSSTLPRVITTGLGAHGVAPTTALHAARIPPISVLFAAFLGYNPIQHLLGPHALAMLTAPNQAILTGRSFFPT